jgi:hypothetical protein
MKLAYAHISAYYCTKSGHKQVTVRANGKAHRACVSPTGQLEISCRCPGSQNGSLKNRAMIIADGWETANCEN